MRTIGALTLQNNVSFGGASGNLSTFLVDIASGANQSDRLTIGGVLDLSGAFDRITFSGTPDGTSSYLLATASGGINGVFDFGSAPAGYQFLYGTTDLTLVPVPEPATWAAGALVSAVLVASWAKRRRPRGLAAAFSASAADASRSGPL